MAATYKFLPPGKAAHSFYLTIIKLIAFGEIILSCNILGKSREKFLKICSFFDKIWGNLPFSVVFSIDASLFYEHLIS